MRLAAPAQGQNMFAQLLKPLLRCLPAPIAAQLLQVEQH
jgi:hypothetical protein